METPVSLELERRMLSAIRRSATVIVSTQINGYLKQYFTVAELLLIVFVLHSVFHMLRTVPGFGASYGALRDLTQLVFIQMLLAYMSDEWHPDLAFLNLVGLLLIAECVPAARGWVGSDVKSFKTGITYLFSERVGLLLQEAGVPLAGTALGLSLSNSYGLLGQSLSLTSVNSLCTAAFGAVVSDGSLALAWPIVILYFVNEVSSRYEQAQAFFDFGLYKASGVVYGGFKTREVDSFSLAMGFAFLYMLTPRDPIWGGICALVFVQAQTEWFLSAISLVARSDPVLAGLGVVTALHFVGLSMSYTSSK